jgi:hypothetical protein
METLMKWMKSKSYKLPRRKDFQFLNPFARSSLLLIETVGDPMTNKKKTMFHPVTIMQLPNK